jgi:hypothetical protein
LTVKWLWKSLMPVSAANSPPTVSLPTPGGPYKTTSTGGRKGAGTDSKAG